MRRNYAYSLDEHRNHAMIDKMVNLIIHVVISKDVATVGGGGR